MARANKSLKKNEKEESNLFDVTNNFEMKFQKRRTQQKKFDSKIFSFISEKGQLPSIDNPNSTIAELQRLNADVVLNPRFKKLNYLDTMNNPKILSKITSFFDGKNGDVISQSIMECSTLPDTNQVGKTQTQSSDNCLPQKTYNLRKSMTTSNKKNKLPQDCKNGVETIIHNEGSPILDRISLQIHKDKSTSKGSSPPKSPAERYVDSCMRELSHAKVSEWLKNTSNQHLPPATHLSAESFQNGVNRMEAVVHEIPDRRSQLKGRKQTKTRKPGQKISLLHEDFEERLHSIQPNLPVYEKESIEALTRRMLRASVKKLKTINKQYGFKSNIDVSDMEVLMEPICSSDPYDPEFVSLAHKYLEPQEAKDMINFLKKY